MYFELNDCGVKMNMVWDAMKAFLKGKIISLSSSFLNQKRAHKEKLVS